MPPMEMTPNESQEIRQLEKELDKEARAEVDSVGKVSKRNVRTRKKRRGSDSMSGSPDRPASVQGGDELNGSASLKRKGWKALSGSK